jgi:ABC-type sugar transport system substrate-binding protein
MKRIIVSAVIGLVMTVNLAAGGGSQAAKQTPGNSKVRGKTIGFVIPGPDVYYNFEKNAVKWAVEASGNIYTERNSENNTIKEIQNVENLISLGVDAILMHTTEAATGQKAAQLANTAKIPIFLLDCVITDGPGKAQGAVGSNFITIGSSLGDYVVKNNIAPGGKFVVLGGLLGQSANTQELQSFMDVLGKDPKYKLLSEVQYADWDRKKGEDLMRNYLITHKEIDLVFAMNEEMAYGAALAISEAGRQKEMVIVSANGSEAGEDMLRAGTLLVTAKMSPPALGILGVIKCLEYLNGTPEAFETEVPTKVLTKDNVDKEGGGWFLEKVAVEYETIMKQKGYWNQ